MLSRIALAGIWAYQRGISPRKGYRCAYSVAHGGAGCSGYAKHAIRDLGLLAALPAIRSRFRACRLAYDALRAEADPGGDGRRNRDHRRNRRCGRAETCFDGACCAGEFGVALPRACLGGGARAGAKKNAACDTNPCDGDVGCGSCGVDVCSCG